MQRHLSRIPLIQIALMKQPSRISWIKKTIKERVLAQRLWQMALYDLKQKRSKSGFLRST